MSVEELRKIAKEEASKFIMENLNSVIIFTYIQNLEKEIEELKVINQMQKYRIETIDERELVSKDKIRDLINKDAFEVNTKEYGNIEVIDINNIHELLKEE